MPKTSLRAVPDTNVVIASEKSRSPASPNREFFERWRNEEFEVLYSDDTLLEYIETMREKGVSEAAMRKLVRAFIRLGAEVHIALYHFPRYPADPDDIAFLLCAQNGEATHIVTYDEHLQALDGLYPFRACDTLAFLSDLRDELVAVRGT